ncbi:MAG TPA: hypothetical protein VFS05_11150 [Gemmatimonadaceae bacterium]|nr:hypothetical protein [Gemmatimonadaceae bacterium]
MRAVCIARHPILSEHYRDYFGALGVEAEAAVGFEEGMRLAREHDAEVVLCEYDLLTTAPLPQWEADPALARIPLVAVSLTRRPEEACATDANAIAGFLYLPALRDEDARALLRAATGRGVRVPGNALRWPAAEGERQPDLHR